MNPLSVAGIICLWKDYDFFSTRHPAHDDVKQGNTFALLLRVHNVQSVCLDETHTVP